MPSCSFNIRRVFSRRSSKSIEFVVFDAAPTAGGEPLRLHAFLRGEPVELARHRVQGLIRGIASDGLAVEELGDGFRVRATLDL